jgi:hypothetical protein
MSHILVDSNNTRHLLHQIISNDKLFPSSTPSALVESASIGLLNAAAAAVVATTTPPHSPQSLLSDVEHLQSMTIALVDHQPPAAAVTVSSKQQLSGPNNTDSSFFFSQAHRDGLLEVSVEQQQEQKQPQTSQEDILMLSIIQTPPQSANSSMPTPTPVVTKSATTITDSTNSSDSGSLRELAKLNRKHKLDHAQLRESLKQSYTRLRHMQSKYFSNLISVDKNDSKNALNNR